MSKLLKCLLITEIASVVGYAIWSTLGPFGLSIQQQGFVDMAILLPGFGSGLFMLVNMNDITD